MISRTLTVCSIALAVSMTGCSVSQQAAPTSNPAISPARPSTQSPAVTGVPESSERVGAGPIRISISDLNFGGTTHLTIPGPAVPTEMVNGTNVLIELETSRGIKRVSLDTGAQTAEMEQVSAGRWRAQFQYLDLRNVGDPHTTLKISLVHANGTSQISLPILIRHDV